MSTSTRTDSFLFPSFPPATRHCLRHCPTPGFAPSREPSLHLPARHLSSVTHCSVLAPLARRISPVGALCSIANTSGGQPLHARGLPATASSVACEPHWSRANFALLTVNFRQPSYELTLLLVLIYYSNHWN
jgi:hypothetical protein